jgi:hypothetical protein
MNHQVTEHRRMSRFRLFLPVFSLLVLAACESSTPTAPGSGLGQAGNERVVLEGSESLAVDFAFARLFTTDRSGVIDATVDYTRAASQIIIWIAKGQCTAEQFEADRCTYAATSFAGEKPRKVSVTGAAAGEYTLIVGNLGPDDEQVSFRTVLTSTGTAAVSQAATTSSAGTNGSYRVRIPRR